MKAVVFDLKGTIAHFRRPDTTATQLTYPFITPTAVKGLVGAVLGIEDFVTSDKVGIKLLNPVRTSSQQMSMLGKDAGAAFNRPTTIELLINPAYRIYYTGSEYADRLIAFLERGQSVYPTYLGSAYAITKPILCQVYDDITPLETDGIIETETVVPTVLIQELQLQANRYYSRAGGFMLAYKGGRTFEKSIDFIYEQEGRSVKFIAKPPSRQVDARIAMIGEEAVCLF